MAKGKEKVTKAAEVTQEEKINPSEAMFDEDNNKKRAPGNWIKASKEELAKHEAAGNLIGHDPETGEILLKEE